MSAKALLLLLVCLLALLCGSVAANDELEYDPDEFEGFDEVAPAADSQPVDDCAHGGPGCGDAEADEAAVSDDDFEFAAATDGSAAGNAEGAADAVPELIVTGSGRRATQLEMIGLALVLLYFVMFLYGRNQNAAIMTAWMSEFEELLRSQFAEVGLGAGEGELFLKESQSNWKLYASGRRHCSGMLLDINLRKRHDLVSMLYAFVFPEHDLLTMEVPMAEGTMDNFVFALLRRRNLKTTHSEMTDLTDYTGQVSVDGLPATLSVLSDCKEMVPKLLHSEVKAALNAHTRYFQMMHFTDQNAVAMSGTRSISKRYLRFQFRIPPASRMGELRTFMEMAFHFIDLVATLRLSRAARERSSKARKLVAERIFRAGEEVREEERARKRAEKKAAEDEAYSRLTTSQKRRRDAKEAKKKKKNKMPRMKVMRS